MGIAFLLLLYGLCVVRLMFGLILLYFIEFHSLDYFISKINTLTRYLPPLPKRHAKKHP